MKLVENTLFLDLAEVLECGISTEKYLWKAKSTGSRAWHFLDDPDDRRRVLVGYDHLKDAHKSLVLARFGNPYDRVARQPLLRMVQADPAAHDYYFGYQYDRAGIPVNLTSAQVAQSTRAAAWLSLVEKWNTKAGVREVMEVLGLKLIPELFKHAADLIELDYQTLRLEAIAAPPPLSPPLQGREIPDPIIQHCLQSSVA